MVGSSIPLMYFNVAAQQLQTSNYIILLFCFLPPPVDANIKNVNITSLNATCDNITTTYDPALPEFLANAQQEVNDFISDEVKTFLSETFVDTLTLAIDAALEAASRSWSFWTGAGWVASFARANAATAAGNFVRYGLGFGN